jgi:hypothetical protein
MEMKHEATECTLHDEPPLVADRATKMKQMMSVMNDSATSAWMMSVMNDSATSADGDEARGDRVHFAIGRDDERDGVRNKQRGDRDRHEHDDERVPLLTAERQSSATRA